MKSCNTCRKVKPLSDFSKRPAMADGHRGECKQCSGDKIKKYRKTKVGLIGAIYRNQRSKSRIRNHPLPDYSLAELKEWALSQNSYHELHRKWVDSGFNRDLVPSFDRIDDYKPYTFDNLKITTWRENNSKGYAHRREGINSKVSRAIRQINSDGATIACFYSIRSATRKTGITGIQNCISAPDKYKTAGGYRWEPFIGSS